MSDCLVRIDLDDDDRGFKPGDKIVGAVHVECDADRACEQLRVRRQWRASGRARPQTGGDDDIVLFEGKWNAGQSYEYPFIFHVPPGPYSYSGELIEVAWQLVAHAELDDGEQIESVRGFVVEAAGDEDDFIIGESSADPDGGRQAGLSAAQAVLGGLSVGLMVVAGLLLLYPNVAARAGANMWTLLGGVGSWGLAGWLVHNLLQRRGSINDDEMLAPCDSEYHVEPGDYVSFAVELQPNFKTSPKSVSAVLKGYEKVRLGDEDSQHSDVHRFFEEPIPIEPTEEGSLTNGQRSSFRVRFRVPEDAPFSFHCSDSSVVWSIEVHVDVGSWPNWSREFPLIVRPCADAASVRHESRAGRDRYG
ncbi:MAG: hypothetical protein ACLFVJ_12895 [Persicimonas sp.]